MWDSWDSGCGNVIVQQSTGGDISLVAVEGSRNFASPDSGPSFRVYSTEARTLSEVSNTELAPHVC